MKRKLAPAEQTDAMTDGLARQIIMWTRFEYQYGSHLHDHLRRCGTVIPAWLEHLIPDEMHVPPKAAVASAIYKAMLAAAPDPLDDDELVERVARAIDAALPDHARPYNRETVTRVAITAMKGE